MLPFDKIWLECQLQHQSILPQRRQLQAQRLDKNSKIVSGVFAWLAGLLFVLLLSVAMFGGQGGSAAKGVAAIVLTCSVVGGLIYYLSKPAPKPKEQENLGWLDFYQSHGSPLLLLIQDFFPFLVWRTSPDAISEWQSFASVLGYNSHRYLLQKYIYEGQTQGAKLQFWRYALGDNRDFLLIRIQKTLACSSDLFVKSADIFWTLPLTNVPEELKFGYFPELERFFHIYSAEKAQAAEFLQRNEDLLIQLFDFQDYPIRLIIRQNELLCFWDDYEAGLWGALDEEIKEDKAIFEAYYAKLERLQKLLDILLRMS